MDFYAQLDALAEKIEKLRESVATEEATKTSFVLPLLQTLGYDIFDPTVVVPEFTADIGRKKGEKVDYAIMIDGEPLILIEVKPHVQKLDRHKTQLERYFTVTPSKFAILTNGIEYRFYSDLDEKNIMDEEPFLVIDMLDLKERDKKELEKFRADKFDIDNILSMAGNRKYINSIKELLRGDLINPSDEFVRFFASKLTDKPLRHNVIEKFKKYAAQAFKEIQDDIVLEKINSLKERINEDTDEEAQAHEEPKDKGVVTTEEELEGYYIIKSILAEHIPLERIAARDTKSYFGVLLDDNNRKWIARLHFNTSNKYLGLHIEDKKEEKYPVERLEDIYKYKDQLIDIIKRLDNK